jgi:inhibitor of KinA sporulation pathway (predicted exonuclease)
LTGIRDQDVANAPDIVEAWNLLKVFQRKFPSTFMNPLVWGSGTRNDSSSLFEEYQAATEGWNTQDKENFMGFRVLDAKTLFVSLQLFENDQYAGGLADSMKRLGLVFEGDKHRALTDAKNTFTIWYHLTRKMHDGSKNKK